MGDLDNAGLPRAGNALCWEHHGHGCQTLDNCGHCYQTMALLSQCGSDKHLEKQFPGEHTELQGAAHCQAAAELGSQCALVQLQLHQPDDALAAAPLWHS